MRQLNGAYTQANCPRQRSGQLLKRYKAPLVGKESQLLELARYIVLNPVRAKWYVGNSPGAPHGAYMHVRQSWLTSIPVNDLSMFPPSRNLPLGAWFCGTQAICSDSCSSFPGGRDGASWFTLVFQTKTCPRSLSLFLSLVLPPSKNVQT